MKLTTYAQTLHDLSLIKAQGLDEVILGMRDFSRFGKLKAEEFKSFSQRARELGLIVIFEWDILMCEEDFHPLCQEISQYLNDIDVLRVQDPGAFEWALRNSDKKLHFIAENGNHNLVALQGWSDHAQGRLERIALSIELPQTVIEEYVKALDVKIELLGFGRILLFYTPRKLLKPLAEDKYAYHEEIEALGESEESPHKGFPLIENKHGTFMFHIKDFCVLDYAKSLSEIGLSHLRIDLRWSDFSLLSKISSLVDSFDPSLFEEIKTTHPQDLMKGFYLVNKTDVLFPKLKNNRLQKREGNYIGEVIESEKGSHLAIFVKNPKGLRKTDLLKFVHPKGDEIEAMIYSLRNLSLEEVDYIPANSTAIIQFVGGIWVKSHVFYREP